MGYWLMKSEPDVYSIDDLERDGSESWDGVRNYQARNFMRAMKKGDRVLYYHSNARPSGVVGVAEVAREHYPDPTALDPQSDYFDPKSSPANNRWSLVDIGFKKKARRVISLEELKGMAALKDMVLLNNSRLSVQPVTAAQWKLITSIKGAW